MKTGDLIILKARCAMSGRLGLVLESPYGVPRCARIFWTDTHESGIAMFSNMEIVSEGR